jgi:hypothetical protein
MFTCILHPHMPIASGGRRSGELEVVAQSVSDFFRTMATAMSAFREQACPDAYEQNMDGGIGPSV